MVEYTPPPVAPMPPHDLVEAWCSQLFGCEDKPEINAYELARLAAAWGYHQAQVEFDEAAMGIVPPPEPEAPDDVTPKAQAVLTAFGTHPLRADHISEDLLPALAAALRALDKELGHEVLGVRAVDCSQIQLLADQLDDAEVSQ